MLQMARDPEQNRLQWISETPSGFSYTGFSAVKISISCCRLVLHHPVSLISTSITCISSSYCTQSHLMLWCVITAKCLQSSHINTCVKQHGVPSWTSFFQMHRIGLRVDTISLMVPAKITYLLM